MISRFQVVSLRSIGVKTHCIICMRTLKRNLKVEQTVNPWNVITGTRTPKSYAQVYDDCAAELKEMRLALIKGGVTCRKCSRTEIKAKS